MNDNSELYSNKYCPLNYACNQGWVEVITSTPEKKIIITLIQCYCNKNADIRINILDADGNLPKGYLFTEYQKDRIEFKKNK